MLLDSHPIAIADGRGSASILMRVARSAGSRQHLRFAVKFGILVACVPVEQVARGSVHGAGCAGAARRECRITMKSVT